MAERIDYACSRCGARGCKLWRVYMAFHSHERLYCAPCAAWSERVDVGSLDADGLVDWRWGKTDQIGGLVPAVPDEDGATFWGYTAVPPDRIRWWRSLPSLPPARA